MGLDKMKIGVLTSSRADFGIYMPLLNALKHDNGIDLSIIAFGSHMSKMHGSTIDEITKAGFKKIDTIKSLLSNDDEESISTSYSLTAMKFAAYWANNIYDLVICIGDRFEMAAAVAVAIPFNIKIAHIHGGETTLGSIDNIYRHSISLASDIHFVTTVQFKDRLSQILGSDTNVYVTGSLSLRNLKEVKLLSIDDFRNKWGIDLSKKTLLVTVHPETVHSQKNHFFASVTREFITNLADQYQIVITMPNADTLGSIFRNEYDMLRKLDSDRIHLIENFGTQSFFTCMKHCDLVIGNSSSGIIEAASFNKYVINIGDRQKGRLSNDNVIHCPFDLEQLIVQIRKWAGKMYSKGNIYEKDDTVEIICNTIKNYK